MLPTLKNHNMLIVSKIGFNQKLPILHNQIQIGCSPIIKRGELILFEGESEDILVKRVVGIPGDLYDFRKGKLLINGKEESGNYTEKIERTPPPSDILSIETKLPYYRIYIAGKIPSDYFLLLGDNRLNSTDSRSFGLIPKSRLRGKILFVVKN